MHLHEGFSDSTIDHDGVPDLYRILLRPLQDPSKSPIQALVVKCRSTPARRRPKARLPAGFVVLAGWEPEAGVVAWLTTFD